MKTFIFARWITLLGWVIVAAARLSAAPLLNGGFESGLTDWYTTGNVSVQSGAPYGPTEGNKLVAFNAANSAPNGVLSQGVALVLGHRYKLQFDVGNLAYNTQHQRLRMQVLTYFGLSTIITDVIDIPGPGGGATAWVAASYEFVSSTYLALIAFSDISTETNALDLVLDNVRLTEIPATTSLANGGFESGLTGWTAAGNVTVLSGPPYTPTEGTKLAVFNSANSAPNGSLSQQIIVAPNQLSRLEFDVGNLSYNTAHQRLRVQVQYRIFSIYYTLVDQTIDITGLGGGATKWQASAFEFNSPNPNVLVTFSDVSTTSNSLDLVLDRVRLAPSFQLDVTASVPGSPPAVGITVVPNDTSGQPGGTTPFSRAYLEGTGITLTAPTIAGGTPFDEWRVNGVHFSANPQISIMMDANTTAEAVYTAGYFVLSPNEPFEAVGTGPFTPSSKTYLLTNTTGAAASWLIQGVANIDAPFPDWVTVSPTSGVLGAHQSIEINFTINLLALNLPVGLRKGVFKLLTPYSDQFMPVYLTVNPASLFSNGGFESDFTGWTVIGNVSVRSGSPYNPTEGTKLAAFNTANSTPNGTLRRTVTTVPGRRYRLQFDVGNLAYNSLHQRMQLDVGGVIGVTTHSLVHDAIDIPGPGGGATAWVPASYDFTAVDTSVTMVFADVSQATNALDLVLDNVRLAEIAASTLVNGGFESGLLGWSSAGNVSVRSGTPYTPTEGSNLIAFNAANSNPNGTLGQELSLVANLPYKLEFDVGNLAYNTQHQRLRVQIQYRIFSIYYPLVDDIIDIPGPGNGTTTWQAKSYDFTPGSSLVTVTFTDVSTATNAVDLVLDHVRITP